MLYVIYTAEPSEIITRHRLNVHQYADDTQLYLSVLSDDVSVAVERLDACLVDVKVWLKASRLRLNPTKTQIMWLGSGQQFAKVDADEVTASSRDVSTGFSRVLYWLLPAPPAASACSMHV